MASTPKLKLKEINTIRYSPMEQRLFQLLPTNGRTMKTSELAQKFYGTTKLPFGGQNVVTGCLRSLAAKVKHNREPFLIMRSARTGPTPTEVWIESSPK